ncbi:MAG: AMP-binding protein, partial [bacterium]|nr:AMP-binding protein [bacterium]
MKNNVLKTINHFKIAEEYWLNIFSGEPAEIKMPADFTAPGQYQPGATPVAFGGTLSGKVSTMSSRDHMGAYIILLTAFKIFIFKYTSLNDIIVASPLYNPDNLEYNKFIASRHRIEEGETFKELLMKVKKNVIEGYKHEHFPFDTLSGLLEIDKEVSLFRVAFLFENIHFNTAKKEFIDCLISNYENEITFSVCNTHEELKGELLYNANIFSQESVWRFTRHYLHILQQVLTDVHIKTRDVQWLTKEEKKRLLFDLNDSAAQFPGDKVVHGLFEEQVEKSGDSVALIAGGGNAGENQPLTVDHADIGPPSVPDRERHFTYNQLNEKSNRLAGLLIEKGIGPGAIVALMVERSVELVTGMLAIMKAGGAYLPLDVTDPQTRTRYILADSDVDILLTAKDFSREQDKYSPKNPENTTDSENPMYVIYTSGSTGEPKGVEISHRAAVNFLTSMAHEPGLTEQDVLLA